jgi:hypothetical protein
MRCAVSPSKDQSHLEQRYYVHSDAWRPRIRISRCARLRLISSFDGHFSAAEKRELHVQLVELAHQAQVSALSGSG